MISKKIGITDVVLRDAHQSLLATRLRYEDMEKILYEYRSSWLLVCGIMGWSNF